MVDKKQQLQPAAYTVCIEGSFLPLGTRPFEKATKIEEAVGSKIKAKIYSKGPLQGELQFMVAIDQVQKLSGMDY